MIAKWLSETVPRSLNVPTGVYQSNARTARTPRLVQQSRYHSPSSELLDRNSLLTSFGRLPSFTSRVFCSTCSTVPLPQRTQQTHQVHTHAVFSQSKSRLLKAKAASCRPEEASLNHHASLQHVPPRGLATPSARTKLTFLRTARWQSSTPHCLQRSLALGLPVGR